MHTGQLVFAQIMLHLPLVAFGRMVFRHRAQHKVKDFSCLDQFLALAFAQLTGRESLRDIEVNLRAHSKQLYHMGFRCRTISRNTLANANRTRPWMVFADLAQNLIGVARPLYANDPTGAEFKALMGATVYALDSTTIDLCLSLFSWAPFRRTKAAIKLHTLIDLRGSIPSFIHISDGKMGDVSALDLLTIETGAFYVMDRGYLDYSRLYGLHRAGAFFITRAKRDMSARRVYSAPNHREDGVICDQRILMNGVRIRDDYPELIRRIRFKDPETGKTLIFLSNNMKTQIWCAVASYVLIAIIKKELRLDASLFNCLPILSVSIFEKTTLSCALQLDHYKIPTPEPANQLNLFDY